MIVSHLLQDIINALHLIFKKDKYMYVYTY